MHSVGSLVLETGAQVGWQWLEKLKPAFSQLGTAGDTEREKERKKTEKGRGES